MDTPITHAALVTMQPGLKHRDNVYLLGQVDCPSLGVADAHLVLDCKTLQLTLVAPCGCYMALPLASLVQELGAHLIGNHPPGAAHGTQTH